MCCFTLQKHRHCFSISRLINDRPVAKAEGERGRLLISALEARAARSGSLKPA